MKCFFRDSRNAFFWLHFESKKNKIKNTKKNTENQI
jgi:hypothetical protein